MIIKIIILEKKKKKKWEKKKFCKSIILYKKYFIKQLYNFINNIYILLI